MIAAHTFTSNAPLMVGWILPQGGNDPCGGGEHKLGATTVGGRPVEVPDSRVWYVEPRHGMEGVSWDGVLHEVKEQRIPGLSAGRDLDDGTLTRIGELDHLLYLDLSGCSHITDRGIHRLKGLRRLKRIHLVNCSSITDLGLSVLRSFPDLCVVRLDRMPGITDAGIAHLAKHRNLQLVTMGLSNTGNGAIEKLSGNPSLSHFAPGNLSTDIGLARFRDFPGLTEWSDGNQQFQIIEYSPPTPSSLSFDLRGGMPITNTGLAHLAELQGLYEFALGHQRDDSVVSGAAAQAVAKMDNVRILKWAESICDNEALSHIGKMASLRDLICFNATADDEGFKALAGCDSLEYILAQLCDRITKDTVEGFRSNLHVNLQLAG